MEIPAREAQEQEGSSNCPICVPPIEVFRTPSHYVLTRGADSLWCSIGSGNVTARRESGCDISAASAVIAAGGVCIGVCEGFVGRLQTHTDGGYYLLLARDSEVAGCLASGHTVRRLGGVVCLPLTQPASGPAVGDCQLVPCSKHSPSVLQSSPAAAVSTSSTPASSSSPRSTWSAMRDAATRVSSAASAHVRGLRRAEPLPLRDAATFFVGDNGGGGDEVCSEAVDASLSVASFLPSHSSSSPSYTAAASAVLDDVLKLLNDSDSFYFSVGASADITASVQRMSDGRALEDRFVWNWSLQQCLAEGATVCESSRNSYNITDKQIQSDTRVDDEETPDQPSPLVHSPWFMPLIQGFFQSVELYWPDSVDSVQGFADVHAIDHSSVSDRECCSASGTWKDSDAPLVRQFRLTLVSRRSRYRAGTRYLRRGVDSAGHTANYVETEQILTCGKHHLSFVQVRGSVPVFWSQPGNQFRPPPLVHVDPAGTQLAFSRHVTAELRRFSLLHLVSLVDLSGRERALSDAYLDCVLSYNSAALTFTAFDFHEHCRGLKFENVALLIGSLSEAISSGGFTWADDRGILRRQSSVFRTNCVDCLDRTNVVQTAIARQVLDKQLNKLGVLPRVSESGGGAGAADPIRSVFQEMWADNGDAISRQYAGTGALKADFTRTGERRLAGMIGDGVRSASRYYLKRFCDASRQTAIDVLLGTPLPISVATVLPPGDVVANCSVDGESSQQSVDADEAERVRLLVQEACTLLVGDEQWRVLGAWPMVEASPDSSASSASSGGGSEVDAETDTVLILTGEAFVVVAYDDSVERLTAFQTVPLSDLVSVELLRPPDGSSAAGAARQLLRAGVAAAIAAPVSPRSPSHSIRLHYRIGDSTGYFHQLRPASIRFFNNVPLPVRAPEQQVEALTAVADAVRSACAVQQLAVPLRERVCDGRTSRSLTEAAGNRQNGVLSLLRWKRRNRRRNSLSGGRDLWSVGVANGNGSEKPCVAAGDYAPALPDTALSHRSMSIGDNVEDRSVIGQCSQRSRSLIDQQPIIEQHRGSTSGLADQQPIREQQRSSTSRLTLPDIAVMSSESDTSTSSGRSLSLADRLGSALSPITSPARDTVLTGFSLLARGVQRHLTPTGLSASSTHEEASSATRQRPHELSERLRERIAGSLCTVTIL